MPIIFRDNFLITILFAVYPDGRAVGKEDMPQPELQEFDRIAILFGVV